MKNKIVFSFDEVGATRHIENVISRYVNPVNAVAAEIARYGLGIPTREIIKDAIYNDGKMVYDALVAKSVMPEDETLATLVNNAISNKMTNLRDLTNRITQSKEIIYNGMAVKNPLLFEWVVVDEHGIVSLDEKIVESIREECRVYISTELGIKLHNLQRTIVESMQEIHDELYKITYEDNSVELHPTARMAFIYPFSIIEKKEDVDCRIKFVPRNINFDPQPVVELNEIDD